MLLLPILFLLFAAGHDVTGRYVETVQAKVWKRTLCEMEHKTRMLMRRQYIHLYFLECEQNSQRHFRCYKCHLTS